MKYPWEDIDSCSYLTGETEESTCGSPACAWYDATTVTAYRSVVGRCKIHPPFSGSVLAARELSRDEAVAMSVMAR